MFIGLVSNGLDGCSLDLDSKTIYMTSSLQGGVSAFWKHIVRLFKDDIHVQVVYKEERIPLTLKYAGIRWPMKMH